MPAWRIGIPLLGLVGCGELLGTDDYSAVAPPATYRSSVDIFPTKCRSCLLQACKDEVASCDADPVCQQMGHCLYGRLDPGGAVECGPLGSSTPAAALLATCALSECIPSCDPALPWACAGAYDFPAPKTETAVLTMQWLDYGTAKPLPGVVVKACDRRDPPCTGADSPYDQQITDATGTVTLTVPMLNNLAFGLGPDGFDGFFELTGSAVYPNLRYGKNPIIGDLSYQARVISEPQLQGLLKLTKSSLAADRGLVNIELFDCTSQRAGGVRFELSSADAESVPYYFRDGLPDTSATQTSSESTGGFINVPAGAGTIHAYLVENGEKGKEVSFAVVNVRPGALTNVNLAPSPRQK